MKTYAVSAGLFGLAVLILAAVWILPSASSALDADEDFSAKQPSAAEQEKAMQAWMETMKPTKNHRWLGQLAGDWETITRVWMAGPGAPPEESKGTTKWSWGVPEKWLHQQVTGVMMGTPFTGFGILGYDNFKKKFVGTWYDSMSTGLATFEGGLDQSGKVLRMWGHMDEPMTGEHDKEVLYVTRIVAKDKLVFELHDLAIGEPNTKVVEVQYQRKK